MHFVSVLKRKADFELDFELFRQHKNIVSEFKFNRVGWQKWYGNRVIVRREISEGEPERFTGNSKWLFVLKLPKTLVNSASERLLCNSGKLK